MSKLNLSNILSEISINPPVNKRKAFDDMLDFDELMLASMIRFDTLDEFIEEYGYDSLEEVLTDHYGITDPQSYIPLITNFYRAIKPEDIAYVKEDATITSVAGYKNVVVIQWDIGERNPIYNFLLLKF